MRPITFICALAATLQLLSVDALAGGWTWPVRGPVITPYRNGEDPYAGGQHRGVDIGAQVGTRVVAAAGGTITFAGVAGSSGLVVSERTADGRFDLSYLHLSSVAVHRGEPMAEGAAVGAVGTTGRRSAYAPHLHFGVREAGRRSAYRDPLDFLAPPAAGDRHDPAPAPVPLGQPAAADPSPAPAAASGHAAAPAGASGPAPAPAPVPASPHGSTSPGPARALGPMGVPGLPRGSWAPSLHRSPAQRALAAHAVRGLRHQLLAPDGRLNTAGRAELEAASHAGAMPIGPGHGLTAATGPDNTTHRSDSATLQRSATTQGGARSHHGIDLGWLAACIGLIALATALGHPDGTRHAAARSRAVAARRRAAIARSGARLGALLRPASRGGQTR